MVISDSQKSFNMRPTSIYGIKLNPAPQIKVYSKKAESVRVNQAARHKSGNNVKIDQVMIDMELVFTEEDLGQLYN